MWQHVYHRLLFQWASILSSNDNVCPSDFVGILWDLGTMTSNATFNNLYRSGQFYWWRKHEYQDKITDLLHVTDKLYHKKLEYWSHVVKWQSITYHDLVIYFPLFCKQVLFICCNCSLPSLACFCLLEPICILFAC